MTQGIATGQSILVVGGGISGITAALEAAERGRDVILVEKNPSLGGRTVQLYRYLPRKRGTRLNIPVTYNSQLMTVAYGGRLKEAGLDGHVIRAKKLEEIAIKVVPVMK